MFKTKLIIKKNEEEKANELFSKEVAHLDALNENDGTDKTVVFFHKKRLLLNQQL